ncbi:MAG TPA: FecR domain-containing protein [Puia sp.]|jgi:transmembrane sensor|nr:FecR domain-containing protein [Puia sp.]
MNPSQRLRELFGRYLQRQCEPSEVAELIALLEQADAAETLTPPMRRLWEELKTSPVEYPVDWDRMYTRVSRVENDLSILNRPWRLRRIGRRIAVAAGVLLLAGGVLLWAVNGGRGGGTNRRAVAVTAVPDSLAARVTEARETKRVVHLPDGSTVILNRNSRLEYPPVFSGVTREVQLTGEAFFDITHRTGRPFVVHTGRLTTRVLGTTFNIRAYPADRAIAITVTSGKVQVMKENASLGLLGENQQLRYDKGSEALVERKVDVKPLIAWKPEEVSFDDITMEEAARRIGDWFGVKVGFANPVLRGCRVTATFYREDELEEIMTVVCGVSQSTFTIHDKNVLIDGRGCN